MSRVFWDTNLFIYLVEGAGTRYAQTRALAEQMQERGDELFASTLSLGEVLVVPYRSGNDEVAISYEQFFRNSVQLVPFDDQAARYFAEIRRDRSIRSPDAILLASAAYAEVDVFFTNDEKLSKKRIPRIGRIATLDHGLL